MTSHSPELGCSRPGLVRSNQFGFVRFYGYGVAGAAPVDNLAFHSYTVGRVYRFVQEIRADLESPGEPDSPFGPFSPLRFHPHRSYPWVCGGSDVQISTLGVTSSETFEDPHRLIIDPPFLVMLPLSAKFPLARF